tara:strand:- start:125 stop:502 length:378 start_codon:yes stop_codon:yes gene_type:complete
MTTISEKKLLKLGEDFKKLKAKLESSRKVNEELRKENEEIIPELRSKNMIQFQEIKKLKEENEKLQEERKNFLDSDKIFDSLLERTNFNRYILRNFADKDFIDYITYLEQEIKLKDEIIRLHEST